MIIRTRNSYDIRENDVTPESVYRDRRLVLKALGLGGVSLAATPAQAGIWDSLFGKEAGSATQPATTHAYTRQPLEYAKASASDLVTTPEGKATYHNNFYEFGTAKTDPADNSGNFVPRPWTLEVGGEVEKPTTIDVWDFIHSTALEERIYRMRCVEAWSMNIPWLGVELGKILKSCLPTSRAKYVAFQTVYDPARMPGQKNSRMGGGIVYPYVEGLRIDEAMHPLTLLVVGMYGKTLPVQNGAPIRLMSPWKYGFKGIKSIVKIQLVESMPPTTWNLLAPEEYGFYANVNPAVDHPRWSQASERFIADGAIARRQPTLPFNGYAEAVASLYQGMDLRRYY